VATVKHALLALLTACGTDDVQLRIVIDQPAADDMSEARAFPDLDSVELQVAIQGKTIPLVTRTFQRDEPIELPDVPYAEDLVVHMIGRVGPNEVAFGRTCPFSLRVGEDPPTPHLYFSRTVKWARFLDTRANRPDTRDGATALTDASGNALYIGGVDQTSFALTALDRFNAIDGVFEPVAEVEPRRNGSAAQLGDGRIVIAGGTSNAGIASDVIEIVNLEAETDQRVERFITDALAGTTAPAMTSTSDGAVVAFGGTDKAGKAVNAVVDIRAAGAFPQVRELPVAGRLSIARKQHTATRMSDDLGAPILIIGGLGVQADDPPIARAELYKPLLEQMAPNFTADMQRPRRDHKAVRLPDGSVLVVGGLDKDLNAVRELEIFTFDAGFQIRGQLPEAAGITDFSVTPLPDGSVLFAGGRDAAGNAVKTTFIIRLRPGTDVLDVVTTAQLQAARQRHQATLLCDGTVMLVGGTPVKGDPERYNPPSTGRR
jgi:hypothetical protein